MFPAVYGLAGIFLPGVGLIVLRAAVIIDYQNVHLTAHDVFDPRGDRHDSLIHPMQFARRAVVERNDRQREGFPLAQLSCVRVFRGLPHVDHDWEQNRRCLDQQRQWVDDGAIVELRDLKYRYRSGADGRPVTTVHGKKEPEGRGQEKGIDVLCALAAIHESERPDIDLVILASRDTDLVPVLDELHDRRQRDADRYSRIETVAWFNPRYEVEGTKSGGSLRPTAPRRIWNTNLGRAAYDASVDRNDYR
ncbi:hypothetical protein [Microbacterium maritypicum]